MVVRAVRTGSCGDGADKHENDWKLRLHISPHCCSRPHGVEWIVESRGRSLERVRSNSDTSSKLVGARSREITGNKPEKTGELPEVAKRTSSTTTDEASVDVFR